MHKIIKSYNVFVGEPAKVEEPEIEESFYEEEEEDEEDIEVKEAYSQLKEVSDEESVEFARKKAEEIIEKARVHADKILEETTAKIEEEREIVLEQARKNGFDEGYNEAVEQCEDLIREAGIIKQQAFEEYEQLMSGSEEEILSIIFDIAKKMIGREIISGKEDILFTVREALKACTHKDYILLKVSEEDYDTVVKSKDKILAMSKGIGELEIKTDHSLEKGSCLLETPFGAVDGSIKTKIEQIEKVFNSLIEKE
ncbi:MAG: FliH/SctL family protein [Deltaproteobacteria bacterium]